MNYTIIISAMMLGVSVLTFVLSALKSHDGQRENNIKMNVKLDSLCNTCSTISQDIKAQARAVTDLEKDVAILKRDIKTAFQKIDEIGGSR